MMRRMTTGWVLALREMYLDVSGRSYIAIRARTWTATAKRLLAAIDRYPPSVTIIVANGVVSSPRL